MHHLNQTNTKEKLKSNKKREEERGRMNSTSGELKSHENHTRGVMNPRTPGGLGLPFPLQITRNTPRIFSSCDLSHETLTLEGRGKNESGERADEARGLPSSI
jgi:hypothetical protein